MLSVAAVTNKESFLYLIGSRDCFRNSFVYLFVRLGIYSPFPPFHFLSIWFCSLILFHVPFCLLCFSFIEKSTSRNLPTDAVLGRASCLLPTYMAWFIGRTYFDIRPCELMRYCANHHFTYNAEMNKEPLIGRMDLTTVALGR